MATFKSFASRMRRIHSRLPHNVNQVAQQVATATLNGIVTRTPVDTSQAVSNWQIGFDESNNTNLPPHFPGKRGSTAGASRAETLAVGRIMISGKRPGVALHISNGLDYIEEIDDVYNFKQAGLQAGRAALAKAKLDLDA